MNFRRTLLISGIAGPVMYVLHDIIGAYRSPNFSFIENTVSDLTNSAARGDYALGVTLLFLVSLTGTMFGIGVVVNFYGSQHNKLVYAGIAIAVTGFIQLFSALLFPQDPIGTELTFSGTLHLVIVTISAILAIAQLVLVWQWASKTMNWKGFAALTLVTFFFMFAGGLLTAVVTSQHWSVLGLVERAAVYPFQVWTLLLALLLIHLKYQSQSSVSGAV